MNAKKLVSDLASHTIQIGFHQAKMDEIGKKLIDLFPVKVGDVVRINNKYQSFTGKKIQVEAVSFDTRTLGWVVSGYVLKKDGTKGYNYGQTYYRLDEVEFSEDWIRFKA